MTKTILIYRLVAPTRKRENIAWPGLLRRRKLNYEPDKKCRDAKGFSQDSRSLTANLLVRLGLLPPVPSRWNPDGTWNW